MPRIRHAGSIFLGPYAPVPVGDYASGTNHVLPTGGCARMFSGLSVDDFIKKPTFQHLSREALAALKDTVITLAESEGCSSTPGPWPSASGILERLSRIRQDRSYADL